MAVIKFIPDYAAKNNQGQDAQEKENGFTEEEQREWDKDNQEYEEKLKSLVDEDFVYLLNRTIRVVSQYKDIKSFNPPEGILEISEKLLLDYKKKIDSYIDGVISKK